MLRSVSRQCRLIPTGATLGHVPPLRNKSLSFSCVGEMGIKMVKHALLVPVLFLIFENNQQYKNDIFVKTHLACIK